MYSCKKSSGSAPSVDRINNLYSSLALTQEASAAGSEYIRTIEQDVGLEQDFSDFIDGDPSDTLSLTSLGEAVKDAVASPSDDLGLNQGLTVSGGRAESGGGTSSTYSLTFDSSAVSDSPKGTWVYIDESDGEAKVAVNNDTLAKAEVACVLNGLGEAGETVQTITEGVIELFDWTNITGSASLTPGVVYYLDTDGGMTKTAPSSGFIVTLGRAITATQFDVEISLPWAL